MRSTWKIMALLSAIYSFSPFLYAQTSTQNNLVAAGWYFNNTDSQLKLPLLAASDNQGQTWDYPSAITSHLPYDYQNYGEFHATDCNQDFCIAVGTYQNTSGIEEILLTVRTKQNNTWKYIPTQPADYAGNVNFGYSHASCNSQFCAIAANYKSKDGRYLPLLALSKDQGNSWIYPSTIISKLPSDFTDFGIFDALDCKDDICVAVGSYGMNEDLRPLIAVSIDQGVSWSYPQLKTPPNATLTYLNSIQCQQDFCVAAGYYETVDKILHPYIVHSTDKGTSWEQAPEVTTGLGAIGQLVNVQCDNKICIATGNYQKKRGELIYLPLVAISKDKGKSWTYPATIISTLPDKLHNGANFLESASCNGNNCITGGQSFSKNVTTLMAKSKDGGETWSYVSLEPADFFGDDARIKKVSCTSTNCLAIGYYRNTQNKMTPLLAMSTNGGSTWEFPSTVISSLPLDYGKAGAFSAGSTMSSSLMKYTRKILTRHE